MWKYKNTAGGFSVTNTETNETIVLDEKQTQILGEEIVIVEDCEELTQNDIDKSISDFIQYLINQGK